MKKLSALAFLAYVVFCSVATAGKVVTSGPWTLTPGGRTFTSETACLGAVGSTVEGTWHCTKDDLIVVTVPAPPPPAVPTVSLSASPASIIAGGASTLTWASTSATSCTASGGWSGTLGTSGFASTGALASSTAYTLTCNGTGGSANQTITVAVTPASTGTQFGLEWPGTGAVRRMLLWSAPFPIYDATYIFKVYPRKKIVPASGPTGYYTTFFWGNNGDFSWNGRPDSYYGAHPYPEPPPNGPGQWEVSVWSYDFLAGSEVVWGRWYTQAFRAWRESSSVTHHEFYWDLPDTNKVIRYTVDDSGWAKTMPPRPAIVMGQAPNVGGYSWGGYPGWEEFNGVIRGLQFYSGLLSVSDILNELAAPQSTPAGGQFIWYLNLDPRPSDVTDKKAGGVPHNPTWDGTTALEWAQ